METEYEKNLKTAVCLYDDGKKAYIRMKGAVGDQLFLIANALKDTCKECDISIADILKQLTLNLVSVDLLDKMGDIFD